MFLSSQGDSITFGVPNLMSLSPLKLIWDFHHWGAQSMELKWSLIYFLTLVCLTAGLMNTKYTTLTSCLNSTHESPDTPAMVLCLTPAISCFNEIQTRVFNVVIEGSFIDKCWHSSVNKLNIVTALKFIHFTAVISCDFNTPKHRLAFHPKDRNMHCWSYHEQQL